jgi:hypothetical protein
MRQMSSPASVARPAVTHAGEGVLRQPLYWVWVLVALTVCYIVNVMDRSQILAASLQAIKKEFGATDFQLGMLSGIPFALFYSILGIPIAALADRWNRVSVLALSVGLWSGMTALLRHGGELSDALRRARRDRLSGRRAGARRRTRSFPTTFPRAGVAPRSRSTRWPSRLAPRSAPSWADGATRISAGGTPSSSSGCRACCWPWRCG